MKQPSDSLSRGLADFLCSEIDQITRDWVEAVQQCVRHAEQLTFVQLVDHIPAIFDDLADVLRDPEARGPRELADEHARCHGGDRAEKGYALPELVREIGIVRRVISVDWFDAFVRQNPGFSDDEQKRSRTILHEFFDDMASVTTTQFVKEQQRKLEDSVAKLEAANRDLQEVNRHRSELDKSRQLLTKMVSHELGNILNIQSAALNLLAEEKEEPVREQMLFLLRANIGDMADMFRQLRGYAELIARQVKLKCCIYSPSGNI